MDPTHLQSDSRSITRRPTSNTKSYLPTFFWHNMKRDIRRWCRECHPCQVSKVHRHTKSPLAERTQPEARFCSLHVDLVGPLPSSQGMTYIFTIMDRFTRWPEAVPIPDAHASTCALKLCCTIGYPDLVFQQTSPPTGVDRLLCIYGLI